MPRLDLIPEDVTTGRPGKPGTCPIARSIVRAGYIKPRVTGASIRFTDPETGVRYAWPSTAGARRFMREFDAPLATSHSFFEGKFLPWVYSWAAWTARLRGVERKRLALLPFRVELAFRHSTIVGRP